jgi:aminopeptidase N
LIDFSYENRETMFDAHSYNKGGAILHMLRNYLGDEAFFAALSHYLKKNEYSDVEAHELRLAFEDVSGQDLNWFFNQWFFNAGHPNLDILYDWDESTGTASVTIDQTQDASNDVPYIFDLPLQVDIYDASGTVRREAIRVTKRSQTFTFDAPAKPALINVDAEKALLAVKHDDHTPEEWAFMYRNAPLYQDRWEAIEVLKNQDPELVGPIMREALQDKHWSIRREAIGQADITDAAVQELLVNLAKSDPEPAVRAAAISTLGQTAEKKYIPIYEKGMQPDQAYSILGASLDALSNTDPMAAVNAAKALESDENPGIVLAVAELYAANPTAEALPWFQKQAQHVDNMAAFKFYELNIQFLLGLEDMAALDEAVKAFQIVSLDPKASLWRRFSNTKAINDLRGFYAEKADKDKVDELTKIMNDIREKETDETLKLYYGMFDRP